MRRLFILFFLTCSSVLSWAQSTKFNYLFLEAERQKLARNYDAAIDLFDYCSQLDTESGVVLYELADLYRYVKNDSLSIAALKKACQLEPTNYWYKSRLVSLYLENRRNDEALQLAEDMARLFPTNGDVLLMLLELYEKQNDYANMVKVLDKIEVKEGKSEQLSMEKFRLLGSHRRPLLRRREERGGTATIQSSGSQRPRKCGFAPVNGQLLSLRRRRLALPRLPEADADQQERR